MIIDFKLFESIPNLYDAARYSGPVEIQRNLDDGYDINAPTADSHTALILASMYGKIENIEYLINHGANMYIKNNRGEDFYDTAPITPVNVKEWIAKKYPAFTRTKRFDL